MAYLALHTSGGGLLCSSLPCCSVFLSEPTFFFFGDRSPAELYTLSLHDALPILACALLIMALQGGLVLSRGAVFRPDVALDRKSTRLNSSHRCISYAVFCLKKKKSRILLPDRKQDSQG